MKVYRNLFDLLCATLLFVVSSFATHAEASVIDSSGTGFLIPDDSSAGASSVITIGVDEDITDFEITLFDLDHSWVGDLIATVTSPAGTSSDLFFRVGNGFFGDSSNLDGDYTFSDSGANFASAAASTRPNADIPEGIYQAATNSDIPVSLSTAFAGESTLGNWTLNISDNAGADLGSLGGWGVNITSTVTAVPEPGSLPLLALIAGLVLAKRRRRKLSL